MENQKHRAWLRCIAEREELLRHFGILLIDENPDRRVGFEHFVDLGRNLRVGILHPSLNGKIPEAGENIGIEIVLREHVVAPHTVAVGGKGVGKLDPVASERSSLCIQV